jgi:hypothetical protein
MRVGFCLLFFAVVAFAQPQQNGGQQTADVGPTILSQSDMQVPAVVAREKGGNSFDYFLFSDGFFNTGVPVNNESSVGTYGNSAGFDVGGGLDFYHYFSRGSVSVNYSGSYHDYSNTTYYSGFQQGLNFNFKYSLAKHLLLGLQQGISTAPNGIGSYQLTQNPYVGANGLAGQSRLYITSVSLVYQASNRLSYQFGGEFFASQYRPNNINDSLGGQGSAGVNYRTSKKTTLGFTYSYAHFGYSQLNDVSNSQTAYFTFAHEISPRTQFSLAGGVTSVAVSQSILFGDPPIPVSFHNTTVFPYFNGRLNHTGRRASVGVQASQSVLAGNGQLNTSKAITVSGNVSYTPSQRWAFSANGGYQHLEALSSASQAPSSSYGSGFGNIGLTYKLSRHFGLKSSFGFGIFDGYNNVSNTPTTFLSFGIIFTSGDRPVLFF